MLKKFLPILVLFLFFLVPGSAQAFGSNTYVTFTNPVVGYENWTMIDQTPLDMPKFQYQESTHSAYPVTWLLRYDAVSDATISAYFSNLIAKDSNQSLGAYLEITPNLTKIAGVEYPKGLYFSSANHIFLSGYTQTDRIRLIDTYMNAFFTRFGFYPSTVGAWHIDSYSLEYLQSRYSVLAAVNCDDQYTTDGYRLWGGYLGSPYFPDKNNSLVPASSSQNRINLALVRWAQRDLFNFYGTEGASSYSVQVNDFTSYGLKTDYFDRLLAVYSQREFNEFTYVNIGLENGYSLSRYRQEIKNIYQTLAKKQDTYGLRFISLGDFGNWLKIKYPESSPVYFYRSNDSLLKAQGEVYWYQSPYYRIGLKSINGQTQIIDFRVYNREVFEDFYATPNQNYKLFFEIPAVIDSIKTPGTELTFSADLSAFETVYDKQWDLWQLTLQNGDQKIIFSPRSIEFVNVTAPVLNSPDVKITNNQSHITWTATPHTPYKDTHHYSWFFWLFLVLTLAILLKKFCQRKPRLPLFLIIGFLCVLLIGLTVFRSGSIYSFGLGFFGPNGHDAIFHLSLIEKFSQNPFDFSHPQYAGSQLTNYHFVFDYLSGLISRIFSMPSATVYFIFMPLMIALSLVLLLNRLMTKWHYTSIEKSLAYFLVFLSGSFGFIVKLFAGQSIFTGESSFWANQSASLFLNPPFALSLVLLLVFLNYFPDDKKISPLQLFKLALVGGLLSQTKIYAFILLVAALFFNRQFILMLLVGLTGTLFTLPFASVSGSPFIFEPLWFPRSLFASQDRFYWHKFVQAWQAYEAQGNFLKLLAVNLFAAIVFFVGNLGLRLVGFLDMFKNKLHYNSQKIVGWIIVVGLLLPLLVIQTDNPWNTIQFSYYSLFFLGLLTAKTLSRITLSISHRCLRYLFVSFFLVLASLTSVGTLKDYLGNFTPSRISFTEMSALETLKNKPYGLVLSPLFQKADQIATPKPLYAYVSTAYISAYSGQPEFLSDTINLDITGFNYQERARDIQRFYNTHDKVWAKNFLQENKIKYIYETPLQKMKVSPGDLSLTIVFDSGEITIYQTN